MTTTLPSVPFSRPAIGEIEAAAIAEVVASGWIVGGPRLAKLEDSFAALTRTKAAVGVSSWTTGTFLVLKCLGIGPGDEVIVPSLTFIASVNVIRHAGATPIFADIDSQTYNLDPADVERRITSRTRAILPVDQIGLPCEIDRILSLAERHGLTVIQDAACSVGSTFRGHPVGALAPVSIFSLHARKVVTTGEGGMIVTNDAALAERLRRMRHQGMSLSDFARHANAPTAFETYDEIGYNARLTDIQAAMGVVQMARLDELMRARSEIAARYLRALSKHPFLVMPHVPDHSTTNWQSFQVRIHPEAPFMRNGLMEALHADGIATRRGVMASHLEAPYQSLGAELPRTEAAAANCMQLPIFPQLDTSQVDRVIEALRRHTL